MLILCLLFYFVENKSLLVNGFKNYEEKSLSVVSVLFFFVVDFYCSQISLIQL